MKFENLKIASTDYHIVNDEVKVESKKIENRETTFDLAKEIEEENNIGVFTYDNLVDKMIVIPKDKISTIMIFNKEVRVIRKNYIMFYLEEPILNYNYETTSTIESSNPLEECKLINRY